MKWGPGKSEGHISVFNIDWLIERAFTNPERDKRRGLYKLKKVSSKCFENLIISFFVGSSI